MKIRRIHRTQKQAGPASTADAGTDQEPLPHPEGHHRSFFDGLDTTARIFFGPAARSDGSTPVVHRHDAAEEQSESALRSIEIHTDSLGHHYAVQKRRPARSAAGVQEQPEPPEPPEPSEEPQGP